MCYVESSVLIDYIVYYPRFLRGQFYSSSHSRCYTNSVLILLSSFRAQISFSPNPNILIELFHALPKSETVDLSTHRRDLRFTHLIHTYSLDLRDDMSHMRNCGRLISPLYHCIRHPLLFLHCFRQRWSIGEKLRGSMGWPYLTPRSVGFNLQPL